MTITNRPNTAALIASQLAAEEGSDLKMVGRLRDKILSRLDSQLDITNRKVVQQAIQKLFPQVMAEENAAVSRAERVRLLELVLADIMGYGPIEMLLKDDTVTEIMVNGPKNIYLERRGKIEKSSLTFESDEHILLSLIHI